MASTIWLLAAFSVSAQDFRFDIFANGFHYGTFDVTLKDTPDAYDIDVTAEAKGIFGFVIRARYAGKSSGIITTTGRISKSFKARSSRVFVDRTSEVRFQVGRPTFVEITPPKRQTTLSKPGAVKRNVLDPLSLLANMLAPNGAKCPKAQTLYDGRRITRVSFDTKSTAADGFSCRGFYEIVRGPDHSLQKGERRFELVLEYQNENENRPELEIVRITSGSNEIALRRLSD